MTAGGPAAGVADRSRTAVAVSFVANGLAVATWAPHVATVRDRFQLTEGRLGLLLLAVAAGALIAMPLTGPLTERIGSARVTTLTGLAMGPALIAVLVAPSVAAVAVALLAFGAAIGAHDVAMNANAVEVQDHLGRPIMSATHGMWSVGGFVGAGLAFLLLRAGLSPGTHATLVAVVLVTSLLAAHRWLLSQPRPPSAGEEPPPRFSVPRGPLVALGLMTMASYVAEGAILDWGAIHLRDELAARPSTAALGYGAFSVAMATARLLGDRPVARLGGAVVVRLGSLVAAAGVTVVALAPNIPTALLGFLVAGVGWANVVPVLFTAAGRGHRLEGTHARDAGTGVAAVASLAYLGTLAGPPLIGAVAEAVSLPVAFLGIAAMAIAVAVASTRARAMTIVT